MTAADAQVESVTQPLKYPKSVFFIIGNELCEGYSYYGMRVILVLYLRNALSYSENDAITIYHIFCFFRYLLPVFGAILADVYIGKYKTIIFSSTVHATGTVIIALAATPWIISSRVFSLSGLTLAAIGSGLLRPCVNPFGGEQFVLPQQAKQLANFFAIFYFMINVAALTACITTPILRQDFKCFGQESCWPLAFGVPALLTFIALGLFVSGKPWYRMQQPKGNVLLDTMKCISYALRKKLSSSDVTEKPSHWLEYAKDKFDQQLLKDIREVFRVVPMYIPVPIYWALANQQGSTWVFQASKMDGAVGNWFVIKPDQLGTLNPLLCILFIPLFQWCVYPALAKIGIKRPLQFINIGAALCALAFLISSYVEYKLEPSYAQLPAPGQGQLRIFNGFPCQVELDPPISGRNFIPPLGSLQLTDIPVNGTRSMSETFVLNSGLPCGKIPLLKNWTTDFQIFEEQSTSYVLSNRDGAAEVQRVPGFDEVSKSLTNMPRLRVIYNIAGTLVLKNQYDDEFKFQLQADDLVTELLEVYSGRYRVSFQNEEILSDTLVESGGIYTLVVQKVDSKIVGNLHVITSPATLHIFWAIPQIVVISVAEIFLSVTYISFTFTQAPDRMKSIMSSVLNMSVSLADVLVVFISAAKFFKSRTHQFLFFTGLMVFDVILLLILSVRYKYRETNCSDDHLPSEADVQSGQTTKGDSNMCSTQDG
nr:PREDICTED: peptide transporter family 1-like [Bemisia tabaci]